jgi:hypothetical protein
MRTVPTITIRFPSNIPNTTGHNVTAAMALDGALKIVSVYPYT